jgi:hypothetical protein
MKHLCFTLRLVEQRAHNKLSSFSSFSIFPILDCDWDSDCDLGLVCGFRSATESDVPGCDGNATEVDIGSHDFCITPLTTNTLVITADYDDSDRSDWPLGMCEADCYDDDDCEGDLACWVPFADGETIPGCIGTGVEEYGYCYSPPRELVFIGDREMEFYELVECQGGKW